MIVSVKSLCGEREKQKNRGLMRWDGCGVRLAPGDASQLRELAAPGGEPQTHTPARHCVKRQGTQAALPVRAVKIKALVCGLRGVFKYVHRSQIEALEVLMHLGEF